MTSFEDILSTIRNQRDEVANHGQKPYYLFISKNLYLVLENGILKTYNIQENSKVEFFENLEIVCLSTQEEYIEVKGINV